MKWEDKGPGRVPPRHRPEQTNTRAYNLSSVSSLAVERAMRLVESLPAREDEIRAKVLRQLHGTGMPAPDHIQVLVHQAGSDDQIKVDCARMAQKVDASAHLQSRGEDTGVHVVDVAETRPPPAMRNRGRHYQAKGVATETFGRDSHGARENTRNKWKRQYSSTHA
jgi:hypothetical protein